MNTLHTILSYLKISNRPDLSNGSASTSVVEPSHDTTYMEDNLGEPGSGSETAVEGDDDDISLGEKGNAEDDGQQDEEMFVDACEQLNAPGVDGVAMNNDEQENTKAPEDEVDDGPDWTIVGTKEHEKALKGRIAGSKEKEGRKRRNKRKGKGPRAEEVPL